MAKQKESVNKKKPADRTKTISRGPITLTKKLPALGLPLKKINYILIACACAGIALGYILMVMENAVDGLFSRTLCPIILIASYSFVIFGLLYRKADQKTA